MQIDVAAVDNAVAAFYRVREVDALNLCIVKAEVLALHDCGEHLLFDGTHGDVDVIV